MALSIASHGYVLETGQVVLDKPAAELLADDDIREFYLGLHPDHAGVPAGSGADLSGDGAEPAARRRSYRDVKHYRRRKRWLS
jgi:branched-chain amino acid transport system ATP-binding protein